jgi:hypothetical protein
MLSEVPYRMAYPGGYHEIVRLVVAQYHVHRPDVVLRVTPVPGRVEVAECQLLPLLKINLTRALHYLIGHEVRAPPRRLVIKEYAVAGEQPIGVPIVADKVVPKHLCAAVRACRLHWSRLPLPAVVIY